MENICLRVCLLNQYYVGYSIGDRLYIVAYMSCIILWITYDDGIKAYTEKAREQEMPWINGTALRRLTGLRRCDQKCALSTNSTRCMKSLQFTQFNNE